MTLTLPHPFRHPVHKKFTFANQKHHSHIFPPIYHLLFALQDKYIKDMQTTHTTLIITTSIFINTPTLFINYHIYFLYRVITHIIIIIPFPNNFFLKYTPSKAPDSLKSITSSFSLSKLILPFLSFISILFISKLLYTLFSKSLNNFSLKFSSFYH